MFNTIPNVLNFYTLLGCTFDPNTGLIVNLYINSLDTYKT